MLFNSFTFLFFTLVTFTIYYLPPALKYQKFILILASFYFYAFTQPVLLFLLIISILINVATSYYVHKSEERWKKKLYVTAGVATNLATLAFFKYSPLFGHTFFPEGNSLGEFLLMIPLPIGISFYTFEGISLLLDTFRNKKNEAEHIIAKSFSEHISNTTLFVAFFPHLTAGPILKAREFMPQIVPKYFSEINWEKSFKLLLLGYFLKVVIADNIKDHTFWIDYPYFEVMDSLTLLVLLYGYSIQIFADFAGYSLIALGLAALFGYDLKQNFNFPYISKTFSEFWTRWHISLSSFLKEYLYFPLGGNRKGPIRTYINLMIVMMLGGLWHGASWGFLLWGTANGIALAIERFCQEKVNIRIPENWATTLIRILFVFTAVTVFRLLFRLPKFEHSILYIKAIFRNTSSMNFTNIAIVYHVILFSLPVVLYHLYYLYKSNLKVAEETRITRFEYVYYGLMLFFVVTNAGSPIDFIYFQF